MVLTALCFEGQAGFGFGEREHLAGVPKEGEDPGKRKQERRGKVGNPGRHVIVSHPVRNRHSQEKQGASSLGC